jgi:hypothetical protein
MAEDEKLFPEKLFAGQPRDFQEFLGRIHILQSSVDDAIQYDRPQIEESAHRALRTVIDGSPEFAVRAAYLAGRQEAIVAPHSAS